MYRYEQQPGLGFDLFGALKSAASKVVGVVTKGGTITVTPPTYSPPILTTAPAQAPVFYQAPTSGMSLSAMPPWVLPAAVVGTGLVILFMSRRRGR